MIAEAYEQDKSAPEGGAKATLPVVAARRFMPTRCSVIREIAECKFSLDLATMDVTDILRS